MLLAVLRDGRRDGPQALLLVNVVPTHRFGLAAALRREQEEADQRLGLAVLILGRLPQRLKLDVLQDALSRAFGCRTPDPRRRVRFDHLALEPEVEHLADARQ